MGGGLVWTSGLGLLTDVFGHDKYGEAVGYALTAVSIGTTAAPLLGGVVYAHSGYSAVSAMNIGTVAVSVVLAVLMVEPKPQSGCEASASSARINSGVSGPGAMTAPEDVRPMARERKEPTGLADERSALIQKDFGGSSMASWRVYFLLLRSGRVLSAMGGLFMYAFVTVSFEAMIPLFVKQTFEWDSRRAALIFLCWIVPGFLGPLAGKASDRWRSPWIPIGGFLFTVPPLLLMRLVTENTALHQVLLCVLLTLVGKCLSSLRYFFFPLGRMDGARSADHDGGRHAEQGLEWCGSPPFAYPTSRPPPSKSSSDRPSRLTTRPAWRWPLGFSSFRIPAASLSVRRWRAWSRRKRAGAPRRWLWRRPVWWDVFLLDYLSSADADRSFFPSFLLKAGKKKRDENQRDHGMGIFLLYIFRHRGPIKTREKKREEI